MPALLPIVNDMIIIIFDLLFYILMFPTREQMKYAKVCIYGGCAVIACAYFTATYVWGFPAAVSSSVCMSIPSFVLFFVFAKYRDSRFVLTFCFVDTVSLMIAFVGRALGFFLKYGQLYAILAMLILFVILLRVALIYSERYQKLLEQVDTGWGLMALACGLIYFAMIFFAGYPRPMVERPEYFPVWLVFALVVLSCYAVFIHSIFKTKRICEQNKKLEREKELYQMAFNDRLTGLNNRAAYMERINDIERRRSEFSNIGFVVIDINEFKKINDTKGHYTGDLVLKEVANALQASFSNYNEFLFRMGGDEFLVMLPDVSEEEILRCTAEFRAELKEKSLKLDAETTAAVGYEIISLEDKDQRVESAYIMADKKMYLDKKSLLKRESYR